MTLGRIGGRGSTMAQRPKTHVRIDNPPDEMDVVFVKVNDRKWLAFGACDAGLDVVDVNDRSFDDGWPWFWIKL